MMIWQGIMSDTILHQLRAKNNGKTEHTNLFN